MHFHHADTASSLFQFSIRLQNHLDTLLQTLNHGEDLRENVTQRSDVLVSLHPLISSRPHGGNSLFLLLLNRLDHITNLLRRILRIFHQFPHFLGNNHEPSPVLAASIILFSITIIISLHHIFHTNVQKQQHIVQHDDNHESEVP